MNESEKIITKNLIKITKKDHTSIPNKLIDMIIKTKFYGAGLAIELLGQAYQSVQESFENGWRFHLETPVKRGVGEFQEIYEKEQIEKIANFLKEKQIIKSFYFDDNFCLVGFINIEFLYPEMLYDDN